VLLTYINQDSADMTRCERVLRPLAAFWLPFAYQHCTDASWQEVQQLARSAVYQLKLHVQYLEDSFGLNSSPTLLEVTQTQEEQISANGWHDSQNFDQIEDFSQEDDILSQFT
jgi:23S rRNA A2030 N6-methylase RlmJ